MKCDDCKEELELGTILYKGHDLDISYCPSCDKIVEVEWQQ